MAKLVLTIDTETDLFEVTLNGKAVDNVAGVDAYVDTYDSDMDGKGPEPHFTVSCREDRGDHYVLTRVTASDSEGGVPSRAHAGCFERAGLTDAQEAIAAMFNR